MTSYVTVTQGTNTTLFRTSVNATEIRNNSASSNNSQDAAVSTDNNNTNINNPFTMTIKMLAELQNKTNDFMNDLVKKEQQQQNQNNNNGAQRRGRGLNENNSEESDENDSDEE